MSWDKTLPFESDLSEALSTFNWTKAAEICDYLMSTIYSEPEPLPEKTAKKCLTMLRRKRRFRLMAMLAEALIQTGQRAPQIKRQYAQALIDQEIFTASELVLGSIIQDSQGDKGEEIEARGLMGRIYKQLYVNLYERNIPPYRAHLERALNEYLYAYRLAPQENLWHGINVVALLARARRDDLPLEGLPDYVTLAEDILRILKARQEIAKGGMLDPWDTATAMEALVALERYDEAEERAMEYAADANADSFEIASTLRQLIEVWQLDDLRMPGARLLPICRAALLRREGSVIRMSPGQVVTEITNIRKAREEFKEDHREGRTTLRWYGNALVSCEAIARIETLEGQGHGTGLLVEAADFIPELEGRVLLLTNAHVVSNAPFPTALHPDEVIINFQMLGETFRVEKVVWFSPPGKLDAALLSLKGRTPSVRPLRVAAEREPGSDLPSRLYLIGHPGDFDPRFSLKAGADDERFSFQDAYLATDGGRSLLYRTPVPGGSSGSALFDPQDWSVVALHHSGRSGAGGFQGERATHVNEGTPIHLIQRAASYRRPPTLGLEDESSQDAIITLHTPNYDYEPPPPSQDDPPTGGGDERGMISSVDERTEARFYFAFESKAVRGRFVLYGSDVDLIFNYALPPSDAIGVIRKADALDAARVAGTPLTIMLAPVGFRFRKEGDSGFRVMNFYDGGRSSDEVRFELRAADAPASQESAETGAPDTNIPAALPATGFHFIFEVGGSILYQFFLPAQLVQALPESWDEESPPPLDLNLDNLKQFGERAEASRQRMKTAVEEVLSKRVSEQQ